MRNNGDTQAQKEPSLPDLEETSLPVDTNEKSITTTDLTRMANAPLKVKLMVLFCMLLLPIGCHFMEATMGTLKTSLKKSMHINNTQFGILLSAVTLVNTVLPLLAGAFVDDTTGFGSVRATTFVSFVIFSGSLIVSLAAAYNNYPAMITGQMIYGLGGGMIVTMQEAILSKWFRNQQLAIVIGVILSLARLVKWLAKMICYPIVNATDDANAPIYIATMICAVGFAMNGVYWYIMCHYGWATSSGKELSSPNQNIRPNNDDDNQHPFDHLKHTSSLSPMTTIRWIYRWLFFLPSIFWMIPWIQFIMSSVLSSFDDIATEYVQFRFQTTTVMAGYQSSLSQVVPIVVGPIMGIIIHRFGHRVTSLFVGTLFLVVSMILMGYTMISPAVGMILFSCALAFGPVSVLSSTAMLLPHGLVGIGAGLHKCANNIGTTIVAVIVGYVQDLTYHDGNPSDDNADLQTEYDGVMILYLSLACGSTLIAVILWWMDRRQLMGWLQADKKDRDQRLEVLTSMEPNKSCSNLAAIGSQVRKTKSYVYVGIYCFWLLAAWVIFFVFALMPVYMNYE
ncbi:major facilitator superfamily domain-containing protein [Halteromyces radiatus]|uniref:major facilitator superfamily domain-containing protein n=1 Tax=Halteromyces radiatus TaxID=101107 RepID=UPI00221F18E9|nr:major facilitator superfamily domain-containing protein [Halteromyces radiatus]KAI8076784.1 major facilitator superfamily domain-containing protein [Halteromyces radiatus]